MASPIPTLMRGLRIQCLQSKHKASSLVSLSIKLASTERPKAYLFFRHVASQQRVFSSRSENNDRDRKAFKVDALRFSVSPEEALEEFYKWAERDQGLKYLYRDGRRRFDLKPDIFSVYGTQPVVHLPGLSAYAGYTYRRSLINPVHNTTLVFMGAQTIPFQNWLLRDMLMSDGSRLSIFPDPWNTPRGQAFQVVKDEIRAIAKDTNLNMDVQTEVLSSRRVYMPTYIIEYNVLGASYQAAASGCDAGAGISGTSHKIYEKSYLEFDQTTRNFLTQTIHATTNVLRFSGPRGLVVFLSAFLQLFRTVVFGTIGILSRIPILGGGVALIAAIFAGFRKFIRPWYYNRFESAEWERQREHERRMDDRYDHIDDFTDNGNAKRYFSMNRKRILDHLSGTHNHTQGDYNWYRDWEQWARKQWEQQQKQKRPYEEYQEQSSRKSRQKQKTEYKWDFDPNDPYAILGIKPGASPADISSAFRREMLKYHPDMQVNATQAEKERATERSKLITEAYRRLKKQVR